VTPATAPVSWLDDPKLARRFGRVSWVLLGATFVLVTKFDFGDALEHVILGAMLTAWLLLNAPVMVGLYKCRDQAHTNPYKGIAIALAMRFVALGFVLYFAAPR
jgi:hypothetical protein